MGRRPTLKTLAELSGLAVPTISRALNDAPDISDTTKARVAKLAKEIGYIPDRAGQRLRTGRTNVISLVLAPEKSFFNQFANMITAIVNGLQGTSFHLTMMPYAKGDDSLVPIKYIVETGAADAVIFNQIEPEDPRVQYLMKHNFPFVTHGRSKWADQHAYVDYDNGCFAERAVEEVASHGRKHILLIPPMLNQRYAIDMLNGANKAAKQLDVRLDVVEALHSDLSYDEIRIGVAQFLAEVPAVDGIITGNVNSAMAAYRSLIDAGRVIGEDIELALKEPGQFLGLFDCNIITIHEDIERAGVKLAKAALQALNHPEKPPFQFLDRPE